MAVEANEDRAGFGAVGAPAVLLVLAAAGWWWSARMADGMRGRGAGAMSGMGSMDAVSTTSTSPLSLAAFLAAWLAMMAAMMLPAVSPVVRLYSLAASKRTVAPLPFFVGGYLLVWTALGIPMYVAWRALMDPIADGRAWAARLAGGVLVLAAAWQLTPLKSMCLRHCRSPMSVFLQVRGSLAKPGAALRLGSTHGLYCLGCCWALMAVLVAMGTMNLAWMIGLAILILLEKNAPWGGRAAVVGAALFIVAGLALIANPPLLTRLT